MYKATFNLNWIIKTSKALKVQSKLNVLVKTVLRNHYTVIKTKLITDVMPNLTDFLWTVYCLEIRSKM